MEKNSIHSVLDASLSSSFLAGFSRSFTIPVGPLRPTKTGRNQSNAVIQSVEKRAETPAIGFCAFIKNELVPQLSDSILRLTISIRLVESTTAPVHGSKRIALDV